MSKLLDRSSLLQAQFLKTTTVAVPELDAEILLRELSVAEVSQFSKAGDGVSEDDSSKNSRLTALLLIMCWVDADGNRVLQESDADMVLERLPLRLLNKLGEHAATISGLMPTAPDEAKKN